MGFPRPQVRGLVGWLCLPVQPLPPLSRSIFLSVCVCVGGGKRGGGRGQARQLSMCRYLSGSGGAVCYARDEGRRTVTDSRRRDV